MRPVLQRVEVYAQAQTHRPEHQDLSIVGALTAGAIAPIPIHIPRSQRQDLVPRGLLRTKELKARQDRNYLRATLPFQ